MTQSGSTDDGILRDIGDAVRHVGRLSETIREVGGAAFRRRSPHTTARVASIVHDSLLDDSVRLRAPNSPRVVTFDAESLSVQATIVGEQIHGQLIPPTTGRVTMITERGAVEESATDDLGRFILGLPPSGAVRILCQFGESGVVTDWMYLQPTPPSE